MRLIANQERLTYTRGVNRIVNLEHRLWTSNTGISTFQGVSIQSMATSNVLIVKIYNEINR
jgi:hypothetical protein